MGREADDDAGKSQKQHKKGKKDKASKGKKDKKKSKSGKASKSKALPTEAVASPVTPVQAPAPPAVPLPPPADAAPPTPVPPVSRRPSVAVLSALAIALLLVLVGVVYIATRSSSTTPTASTSNAAAVPSASPEPLPTLQQLAAQLAPEVSKAMAQSVDANCGIGQVAAIGQEVSCQIYRASDQSPLAVATVRIVDKAGAFTYTLNDVATTTPSASALATTPASESPQSAPTTSKPAASSSPRPTKAASTPQDDLRDETFVMPNVVGMGLQDAQDLLQSLDSYLMDQKDASGKGRSQLVDSNWKVCSQSPSAGTRLSILKFVTLAAVKLEESCP